MCIRDSRVWALMGGSASQDVSSKRSCCGLFVVPAFMAGGRRAEYSEFATKTALGRIEEARQTAAKKWSEIGQGSALLDRLWDVAELGSPKNITKSPHWRKLGFQNDDPVTDLRAAPILGMQHLLQLAENHPERFKQHLLCAQESGYPLACISFNCTYRLLQHLELIRSPIPPSMVASAYARQQFAELMHQEDDTLAEMHIACLGLTERLWLVLCEREGEARLDLMNSVLDEMQAGIEECLCNSTSGSLSCGVVGFLGSMDALPRE
eukprot:TRINITY_DN32710_c0_g1_i1.p1 TRINITY_DN32710_c0_g1~~TRINITY_DN32710_c0_g1_i1.p1  ORF type:complete len:266 (+),score=56.36 TRINITY_DN32710_c0_g1_i1:108-905(+)